MRTFLLATTNKDKIREIRALMVGAPLERMRGDFEHLLAAIQGFGRRASGLAPSETATAHPSPM